MRAIYPAKPQAAREACKLTGPDACDFPTLIGNDEYYGGLGGEFAISTCSKTSGTVVLRHELGHNLGKVGEEYDGGNVYLGENSSPSPMAVKWKHWLSVPDSLEIERSHLALQDYPWQFLKDNPYSKTFNSVGTYKKWDLRLSMSGVQDHMCISIKIDGKPLLFNTNGLKDRSFYEWNSKVGLGPGNHTLEIVEKVPAGPLMPPRQLCSVSLIE